MKFNILGFNQEYLINISKEKNISLNCNDLVVLEHFINLIDRMDKHQFNDEQYSWIRYSMLVEDLPFISTKEDTFKKIVSKFIKMGFIKRVVKKVVGAGAYTYFAIDESSINKLYTRSPIKSKSLKPVDSNGNAPLENQIHVKEIIEESEPNNMDLIKSEFGAIKATQKERQVINQETTEIVLQAIREVKEQGITVTSLKYLINKIKFMKNNENVKKSNVSEVTPKNCNKLKFDNFEPRQYDYDKLEQVALGWTDASLSECMI